MDQIFKITNKNTRLRDASLIITATNRKITKTSMRSEYLIRTSHWY